MNVFFTADEHYGHGQVIAYCQRPFASLEEMDEALIERHNALVKKKDLVYHLGDFAFRYHAPYLNRLHGRHVLILGNHDASRKKHVGTAWEAVEPVLLLKISGRQIWLSHYAHRVWPSSHHGAWHLYGHSHGNLEPFGKSLDVGVDSHGFRPWSLEEIEEVLAAREIAVVDHHKGWMNRREP